MARRHSQPLMAGLPLQNHLPSAIMDTVMVSVTNGSTDIFTFIPMQSRLLLEMTNFLNETFFGKGARRKDRQVASSAPAAG